MSNNGSKKTFSRDELVQALNLPPERIETCLNDLTRFGMIELAGEGRWQITEAGRRLVKESNAARNEKAKGAT